MNFMFSDIGSALKSIKKKGIPKITLLNTNNIKSKKQAFADHLKKQFDKADSQGKSFPLQAVPAVLQAGQDLDLKKEKSFPPKTTAEPLQVFQSSKNAMRLLSNKLNKEKGIGFVSALKEILFKLSEGDLKNFAIDAEGLEALKKMLLKAGFKEGNLDEAFTELLEKTKSEKVTLSDLMGKLSDLPLEEKPEEKVQPESFFEISALPFFESLLNSLGIKNEDIQKIMAEADKGEKGISLDVIIEKLKGLQENSIYAQKPFETIESDRNYQHLMKQLGMEQGEDKVSPLTLNEFVDALENLRKKLSQEETAPKVVGIPEQKKPVTATEKTLDLFSALFKGLEELKQPEKRAAVGFSQDQIKNQFENKLLLPEDKNATTGNTLFSVNKDVIQGSETKQKDMNKNFEVFLNQKKNSEMELGSLQKEVRGVLKQLKSDNSKFIDPLQASGAEAKPADMQPETHALRTKPSLKDLPSYVTHQVSKSLVRAVNQGENILKIQLKPPELGRLVMTIDNTGSTIKVSIMTDNQAAKEILVSNINDIKVALSNSGVNLERFDVDMNSNFQQSMADARNQAGNSGKRQKNREGLLTDPLNGVSKNDPAAILTALKPDGSLHYVA